MMTRNQTVNRRQAMALALGFGGIVAGAGLTPAAAKCLSAKQARQLVKQGKVVRLAEVRNKVKSQIKGQLIDAQLCDEGRLIYRLTVLKKNGKIVYPTADARSGKLF